MSSLDTQDQFLHRADELEELLQAVQGLILPFIRSADDSANRTIIVQGTGAGRQVCNGNGVNGKTKSGRTTLVEEHAPAELVKLLDFNLPEEGSGKEGLLSTLEKLLKYSVNTWDQGFMDKLYASPNPVGIIAELVLATLNTNLHVYHVSPALTVIEKTTGKALAGLFGLKEQHAGGISQPGGSAANLTSLLIARNTLFPESKVLGNGDKKFVLFTSAHAHYSLEKAAVLLGMGSANVRKVPVDVKGRMITSKLEEEIVRAKSEGFTPFYVNATAGTTVLGAYDDFEAISKICKAHSLWFHIDGSWGGSAIFSPKLSYKLSGSEFADSITINPHKMLNCPVTCSFLLGKDLRVFHAANTLEAEYLFHSNHGSEEVWDLADLTLQCGRKGDSLKLALGWLYYGRDGYAKQVEGAFDRAAFFADQVLGASELRLVSENPPPCLQVCFYYAPGGELSGDAKVNTARTKEIVRRLVARGYMVDYAPGDVGYFLRAVVNVQTTRATVLDLVGKILEVGKEVVGDEGK